MTDLEKRAEEYLKAQCQKRKEEFVIRMPEVYIADIPQAFKDGAEFGYNKSKAETALLSQHILDLQEDKGNLTDRVRELEQQIEEMKSDVMGNIKWADQNKNEQMYCKLNVMFNQWRIKEKC